MPRAIIDVHGLAKSFGQVQAVAGVDFDVREAELFGFLGPNGAGKTTTINMLTGLARPRAVYERVRKSVPRATLASPWAIDERP
jgi:ABC-type multidrug transport system ATPase subunit